MRCSVDVFEAGHYRFDAGGSGFGAPRLLLKSKARRFMQTTFPGVSLADSLDAPAAVSGDGFAIQAQHLAGVSILLESFGRSAFP